MRISILSNLYPPWVHGGAELSAAALASGLVVRGHSVTVVTLADAESHDLEGRVEVFRVRSRPLYSPFHSKKKPRWIKPFWHAVDLANPCMAWKLFQHWKAGRPDVVHCHNIAGFSILVWLAARILKIPVVQHLHDYHLVCLNAGLMDGITLKKCPDAHLPCRIRGRYHRFAVEAWVNRIIAPSGFCGHTVLGRMGANVRIHIIPNGTPYAEEPEAPPSPPGRMRILFIGALFAHKGLPVLMSAIRSLLVDGNSSVEFHLAGAGPLEGDVRALAKEYPQVFFHGFVKGGEKLELFRQSDLFVFPSVWLENNPVTITEALALGLPVLGSAVGGVPELLEPLDPRCLLPPGDAEELADGIRYFAENPGHLAELRRKLLAERDRYSMHRQISATLSVYEEAVASSR